MRDDYQSLQVQVYRRLLHLIESRLVRSIEIIEGRVPNREEIALHALKAYSLDGQMSFFWRGQIILEVVPPKWGECVWKYKLREPIWLSESL